MTKLPLKNLFRKTTLLGSILLLTLLFNTTGCFQGQQDSQSNGGQVQENVNIREYLKTNIVTSDPYSERAYKELIQGQYDKAIQDYTLVLNAASEDMDAYFFRAVAKYHSSDYLGALDDLDVVIKSNALDAEAYAYRGLVKEATGNLKGAVGDFESAQAIFKDRNDMRSYTKCEQIIAEIQSKL